MKNLKLIGKGAFSKVYSSEVLDYVIITKCDYIKEAMAFNWFPDSIHFPIIEEIEIEGEYYWKMKKYKKTKRIKGLLIEDDYIFYKKLRKICQENLSIYLNKKDCNNINPYNELYNLFSNSDLENYQKELMLDALSACSNYGADIGFEISPRNIYIDNNRLILGDCFFIKSQLIEIRKSQLNK